MTYSVTNLDIGETDADLETKLGTALTAAGSGSYVAAMVYLSNLLQYHVVIATP